jgi:hypothetical protein
MKQMLIPLTIFLASVSAWAGSGSHLGVALPNHDPVAVFLRQQADYVAMPVTISSDHRDPVQRLADMAAAKRLIQKKAEENPDIIVNIGKVTLSCEPTTRAGQVTLSCESTPSTGTRMGASEPVSKIRLNILVPFKGKGRDAFACATMIYKFLGDIAMPGKARIRTGEIRLAVDNPEQYRPVLLKMIADAYAKTKESVKAKAKGESEIRGLVGPVLVRQADDDNVDLFIDFQLQVEAD